MWRSFACYLFNISHWQLILLDLRLEASPSDIIVIGVRFYGIERSDCRNPTNNGTFQERISAVQLLRNYYYIILHASSRKSVQFTRFHSIFIHIWNQTDFIHSFYIYISFNTIFKIVFTFDSDTPVSKSVLAVCAHQVESNHSKLL